jgi:excinuclease ABC subunit B
VVEQVIRPTGLVDPEVEIRPVKGQVDDLLEEIRVRALRNERVLVTTLTKRMAEDLAEYFTETGVRCRYMHSEVDTLERVRILRDLRRGEFDVLIGINLLREGLDLPEVSLVAILDADKEGYLRSATSLIQTAGRAARHLHGEVILYADVMTQSIQKFLAVSEYRRKRQLAYNEEHHITPRSVQREVEGSLASAMYQHDSKAAAVINEAGGNFDVTETIRELEEEMLAAANNLEFEKAALVRDQINELKRQFGGDAPAPGAKAGLASRGTGGLASRRPGRKSSRTRSTA